PLEFPVHVDNCANRYMTIGLFNLTGDPYTAITLNSATASLVLRSSAQNIDYYEIVNPDTGTNTLSIAYTGSVTVWAIATTYCGVDQASPHSGGVSVAATASTTITLTDTSTADGSWMTLFYRDSYVATETAGTGATKI